MLCYMINRNYENHNWHGTRVNVIVHSLGGLILRASASVGPYDVGMHVWYVRGTQPSSSRHAKANHAALHQLVGCTGVWNRNPYPSLHHREALVFFVGVAPVVATEARVSRLFLSLLFFVSCVSLVPYEHWLTRVLTASWQATECDRDACCLVRARGVAHFLEQSWQGTVCLSYFARA